MRRLVLGSLRSPELEESMSPTPGDATQSPDIRSAGGLAGVFKGLASSKLVRLPSSQQQGGASSPATTHSLDQLNASASDLHGLAANHMEAFEQLKNGSLNERVAAANSLRYAITDYPLHPVLDIWDAAKDLIEPAKPSTARAAGWEILTECAKHSASTDLERKEFFLTITKPANPEDFHLQLAALVDLSSGGSNVSGFDYDIFPLLTRWLGEQYRTVRHARKHAKNASSKATASGETTNFHKLFGFITRVITLRSNVASEAATASLIEVVVFICVKTADQQDLACSIQVFQAIITFGTIPSSKLKACVEIVSSVYAMIDSLKAEAWRTMANLFRSHNGQATIRIILDALLQESKPRDAQGAVAVLEKLLSMGAEDGLPQVPFSLLVEGLGLTTRRNAYLKVSRAVMRLINSLFDTGEGDINPVILEEDWAPIFDVAAECCRRIVDSSDKSVEGVSQELAKLIATLERLLSERLTDFPQRLDCITFLAQVYPALPDSAAVLVLDYFQEYRCCFPSDLQWEANLSLILRAFLSNRSRSTAVRLKALRTVTEVYEMMDLAADQVGSEGVERLVKAILSGIAEETDILVLQGIVSFCVSVAVSAEVSLFEYMVETLRGVLRNDHARSPISPPTLSPTTPRSTDQRSFIPNQSPSSVVTKGYVELFIKLLDTDVTKTLRLFSTLVTIAKSSLSENDARLVAMKLLFRLRADWADRIFITQDVEADGLAASLYRTEASLARKHSDDAAQSARLSRGDLGGPSRASRGISFGGNIGNDTRSHPARSTSGAKTPLHKYHQTWSLPDPEALPGEVSHTASSVLYAHEVVAESNGDTSGRRKGFLPMDMWLDALLSLFTHGCDWEIYSFMLVHLPSQLSNHGIFLGAIEQIAKLRKIICDQVNTNNFEEPPSTSGLRRADVAVCLFHFLTMVLSYHQHFHKPEEDEIVRAFLLGMGMERCAKYCIHALSICCHELPLSISKSLVSILQKMSQIITQPALAMHILEFLACLSRLSSLYVNFREEDYRTVFGICFRYLQYVRDKKQSSRNSQLSEAPTPTISALSIGDLHTSDDLPQYVYALAYHVITFWFLALKLPDRAKHVSWIAKNLFVESESIQQGEEQAQVTIDFMQRVTYADIDESAEDPLFNEERFGEIVKKSWVVANSIVTVKQATSSGWAQVTKRQPSGTSSYTVQEILQTPPPHQAQLHQNSSREGSSASNMTISPSHLFVQLLSPIPQSNDSASRPILLPDDEIVNRALRTFDRNSTVDGHKVGVIYIGENQSSECEILANVSGSGEYVEFLNGLGTLTKLKDAKFNTQGLDTTADIDGPYTFCWRDRVTEIVFHVTTQMPTDLVHDPNCVGKKRHIGNDFVNIIFNDSGLPFRFDTFPSDFNFVNIVITPESRASFVASREKTAQDLAESFYKVHVMSKPGFPEISPAADTKMVSLRALPDFIRLVALNASVFSLVWANRDGDTIISPWRNRLREIVRLRDKYGPRLPPPPSMPAASSHAGAGGAAGQQVPSIVTGGGGAGSVPMVLSPQSGGLTSGAASASATPSPPATASSSQGQGIRTSQIVVPGGGLTGMGSPTPPISSNVAPSSSSPGLTQQQQLQQAQQAALAMQQQQQQQQQQQHHGSISSESGGSGGRPHSFSSLRRSSVATFFSGTSTSEQPSHRSSMLSTGTADTEIVPMPGGGLDALVDSIDFSKWAS